MIQVERLQPVQVPDHVLETVVRRPTEHHLAQLIDPALPLVLQFAAYFGPECPGNKVFAGVERFSDVTLLEYALESVKGTILEAAAAPMRPCGYPGPTHGRELLRPGASL